MASVSARLIGYPRIGPGRELKWALERAWSGRLTIDEFNDRITALRAAHLDEQRGLIGSAVDDFFLYDEVLETAMQLGLVPADLPGAPADDPFGVLTVLARGSIDREAWEMTKWFDANYHYVVPEIDSLPERIKPLPWRAPLGDADTAWAILGPFSLVKLSKLADSIDATQLVAAAGRALWTFVREQVRRDPAFRLQVDEPWLGMALSHGDRALLDAAYA
ncbi:MAG: hypothetical protein ACRDFY_04830, partial [Candidatus Limnocylindria bacterium]